MPELARAHAGIELWVVGQDAVVPQLQARCEQLGVAKQVRFLGWKSQAELIDLYAGADVLPCPR
jgi:glycosyltransferase involved in cell wall biosynthesis